MWQGCTTLGGSSERRVCYIKYLLRQFQQWIAATSVIECTQTSEEDLARKEVFWYTVILPS